MGDAKRKKLARDAKPHEVFPDGHGPVQSHVVDVMKTALDSLRDVLPGYDFTLFASEREASDDHLLPRFNYISTAERADMVNVLAAFILKNKDMLSIDAAVARDPEGSA
ncbi:hypothetical protein J2X65_003205 [Ancylobacter sp. 3268]|uniref:hypothetical protein n=1 Tax=Ancylobacter sp. 3268 TaxID=2817752 RepID=UPI00286299C0|nr:hypothetical protein [Ancylobacter sp. 3268]MDR6953842.1 hypothetical protein [Ancylobacter sp. 3268]